MLTETRMTQQLQLAFPDLQAIYLFGSYATEQENAESDVDIAVLLPHRHAKNTDLKTWLAIQQNLADALDKPIDLLNLRQVSTVMQQQIINANRRIFCADSYAADEFEMLSLSFYQKLNAERADIVDEFWRTGTAYKV